MGDLDRETSVSGSDSSENELLTNFIARKNTVLPRSCLLRAIDAIAGQRPVVGRRAKINATSIGRKARITAAHTALVAPRVDAHCVDRSHLPVNCSYAGPGYRYCNSLTPVVREMRLCLLAADWDGYKELLLALLRSSNPRNRYFLFAVRSCYTLLLNHPDRTPELLDDFMAACMNVADDGPGRARHLRSCFDLRRIDDTGNGAVPAPKMEIDDEDEEEEMFFDADFSSDDD